MFKNKHNVATIAIYDFRGYEINFLFADSKSWECKHNGANERWNCIKSSDKSCRLEFM